MRKPYIVVLSLFLTGCNTLLTPEPIQYVYVEEEPTPNAPNPYDKMSAKQIANLSDESICENISGSRQQNFKINKLAQKEYRIRKLKDCSEAEIFCHGDAGLKVGTEKFASCKLQFTEQQNKNYYREQEIAFRQQQQIQQQEMEVRARERATLYAMGEALSPRRSTSCNSYRFGNMVQTNCY